MTYKTLTLDINDSVAEITLKREGAMNALNLAMAEDIAAVGIECDENPDVRAVLITGHGKMFCPGGDINDFANTDHVGKLLKRMTGSLHMGISRLARGDAPVIIAVNGVAAGAGFSIACGGDIVLASEKAKFVMAYTSNGLVPDGSSTYFLPRRVGDLRARELALTNRMLSAKEAMEWGLVTKVVAPEDLMTEARALAAKLASGPTAAYGAAKRLLNQSFDNSLETQMEMEAREFSGAAKGHDLHEGIMAFLEKRKPGYTGA